MTKSALAVAQEALAVGRRALPAYASKYSRRDYTLPQLFAILVLRKFFRTDYRGVVQLVAEWAELRDALALPRAPHPSTLWHVERKLLGTGGSTASWPAAALGPATAA
jgi:hypothetical protein